LTPRIIGIASSGPGAGKDTVGAMLAAYGYCRKAFGDALKTEVASYTLHGNMIPSDVQLYSRDLLRSLRELRLRRENPHAKPTSGLMRLALQLYGTEYRRSQDDCYWIRAAHLEDYGMWVVTDMRMANELREVRLHGGYAIYVDRPGTDTETHASEGQIHPLDCDVVLSNSGTIEDLREDLCVVMRDLGASSGALAA
jgi:deoxynucleotide monophosphate kinase-like protein